VSTVLLLAHQYNAAAVPVTLVARDYLGVDADTAKRKAARGELPWPVFRGAGQKAPWLVQLIDVAAWIENESAKARRLMPLA
jgi:hypothetical protein